MGTNAPEVELIQEWLAKAQWEKTTDSPKHFKLLAHCTEKTNAAASIKDWQTIFTRAGHSLSIIEVGCCGMSGTYGHETRNRENSAKLFDLCWRQPVSENNPELLLATGFSCRSQTKRLAEIKLQHPTQALLNSLQPSVQSSSLDS